MQLLGVQSKYRVNFPPTNIAFLDFLEQNIAKHYPTKWELQSDYICDKNRERKFI